ASLAGKVWYKHDLILCLRSDGRSRRAIRQGALFGAQAQRAPLSFFCRSNPRAPKNFRRVWLPATAPIQHSAQPNTSNIFVIRSLASCVSSFATFAALHFEKRNVGTL